MMVQNLTVLHLAVLQRCWLHLFFNFVKCVATLSDIFQHVGGALEGFNFPTQNAGNQLCCKPKQPLP